jgi:hypothetical protein
MAVNEYVRLSTEVTSEHWITDETDIAAWDALFSEIPPSLRLRLDAELGRAGLTLGQVYE